MAAKLDTLQLVDNRGLMLLFKDGRVSYVDDFRPSLNARGEVLEPEWYNRKEGDDTLKVYGQALNKSSADNSGSYTLTSLDDPAYASGKTPSAVSRKSKAWGVAMSANLPAMHHWVFLTFSTPLQRGKTYTLKVNASTNSDKTSSSFMYDEFKNVSEAVHVNTNGYNPDAGWKVGDVYIWMGSGGARDFARYAGNKFYLHNEQTGANDFSGTLTLYKSAGTDDIASWYDNFRSSVWRCDFSEFKGIGTYRLVIDSIGSSVPFKIQRDVFREPYKASNRVYFFHRLGDSTKAGIIPFSRPVPNYKPGRTPGFSVVMSAKHSVGINPDEGCDKEPLPGSPTNPNAWGGWRDAADFDRHYMHSAAAFDLMTEYLLSPDAHKDNDLEINESGNGIPDILDEVQFEVDFFLRLRSPDGGYGSAVSNTTSPQENSMCQFGPHTLQAWNVAACCAMLSYCFDKAGNATLRDLYRDSAKVAYQFANSRDQDILNSSKTAFHRLSARCLKTMASVYLYNVTGDRAYEDTFNTLARTRITGPGSAIMVPWPDESQYDVTYSTLGYLLSERTVTYPALKSDMLAAIRKIADWQVELTTTRLSSRSHYNQYGNWSGENITGTRSNHLCMAHRFSTSRADSTKYASALYAEAEWHLGRNPMNMVLMSGLGERCVEQALAPGQYDGYPGIVPGYTPYMSVEVWVGFPYGDTKKFCEPANSSWPLGEFWFNSRYDVGNGETTIHQNLRGIAVLYGYLHGIESTSPLYPHRVSNNGHAKSIAHNGLSKVRIEGTRVIFPSALISQQAEIKVLSLEGRLVGYLKRRNERVAKHVYDMSTLHLRPSAYLCVVNNGTVKVSGRILFIK